MTMDSEINRILKEQREQIESLTERAEKAEASVAGGKSYRRRVALECVKSYKKHITDIETDTMDWSMVSLIKPTNEEETAELIRRLHDMVFFWQTEADREVGQVEDRS